MPLRLHSHVPLVPPNALDNDAVVVVRWRFKSGSAPLDLESLSSEDVTAKLRRPISDDDDDGFVCNNAAVDDKTLLLLPLPPLADVVGDVVDDDEDAAARCLAVCTS